MNNLLLIEDDARIRRVLRILIDDLDPKINVIEAADSPEAKAALKTKGPFNLILSDYSYPTGIPRPTNDEQPDLSMDGAPDLLRHLKTEKITTPVLILSSNEPKETAAKLLRLGLHDRVEAIGEKGGDIKFLTTALAKYFPAERPTATATAKPDQNTLG